MIHVVGEAPSSEHYDIRPFEDWLAWVLPLKWYELDIETVAVEGRKKEDPDPWYEKKIRTIQFGHKDTQWVIQPLKLTAIQQGQLKMVLENDKQEKLIQAAYFELTVFRMYNITIRNVYCTYLVEKILFNGDDLLGYGLDDICFRRLFRVMSKDNAVRMTFGDGILTEAHVLYAAEDVKWLYLIKRQQILELKEKGLEAVAALELDAVISYAWGTAEGVGLNKEAWMKNVDLAYPLIEEAKNKLEAWLRHETFYEKACEMGFINKVDQFNINWKSAPVKTGLVQLLEPSLVGTSKAYLSKWCQDNTNHPMFKGIEACKNGYWEVMLEWFMRYHKDYLINNGLYRPAGTIEINWNSPNILPLFQVIDHKLPGLSKDALGNFPHPISDDLQEYRNALKLTTQYGEDFLKFIEEDGKIRSHVNQIVDTGRISMRKPNLQQVPAKESVGNRYRNCFITYPDWVFVDSDYISQELVLIAHFSKDPVWLGALRRREDLHSVCADLVYGREWRQAAIPGCAYYAVKTDGTPARQKCKCPGHKTMRTDIKTINFGLAYGMSKFKFARTKGCTIPEAERIIKMYFEKFPNIQKCLNNFGLFGYTRGYIMTWEPFHRKRWFIDWKYRQHLIKFHPKIKYDPVLGSIQRASMNMPIQGTAADCAKLSICMIRWYLEDNNLWDKARFILQVHDQNTCIATKEYAPTWDKELTRIMCEAAEVFVPGGLLGAETNVTEVWTK